MRLLSISLILFTVLAFACVPQQQYAELEETLNYYKGEALATDSIRGANVQLQQETNETQADYQALTQELERLTATNISLNRNYQDVVTRYNNMVGSNQRVLETSSYETATLEQELALREDELDKKERSLTQMETQLRSRDAELQALEARGYGDPTGYNTVPDARYEQLKGQKATIDQQKESLVAYFQRVLVGFPVDQVNIEMTTEGVRLTLSEGLLFPQGDANGVYWKGRQALQQIAVVLRDNPEMKFSVISHINPSANTDYDWQASVLRALAVSKDFATFGVDAGRITAAGQGSNQPLVPATNARAQIVNGRTIVDIPMDYQPVLQRLDY